MKIAIGVEPEQKLWFRTDFLAVYSTSATKPKRNVGSLPNKVGALSPIAVLSAVATLGAQPIVFYSACIFQLVGTIAASTAL